MEKTTAAEQLREWLDRTARSQQSFAGELAISEGHLSSLLSGRRSPSLDLALRIERLSGVPVGMWLPAPGTMTVEAVESRS